MDDDQQHYTNDGPDTLIWRLAADSLSLAVSTTQGLVRACNVHPGAQPIAQLRIDTLREFTAMLLQAAGEMQERLDGGGSVGEFDRIVDGYWNAPDDADTDEAA